MVGFASFAKKTLAPGAEHKVFLLECRIKASCVVPYLCGKVTGGGRRRRTHNKNQFFLFIGAATAQNQRLPSLPRIIFSSFSAGTKTAPTRRPASRTRCYVSQIKRNVRCFPEREKFIRFEFLDAAIWLFDGGVINNLTDAQVRKDVTKAINDGEWVKIKKKENFCLESTQCANLPFHLREHFRGKGGIRQSQGPFSTKIHIIRRTYSELNGQVMTLPPLL